MRNYLTIQLLKDMCVCLCTPAHQPNAFFSGYSMHLVTDAAALFASDHLVVFVRFIDKFKPAKKKKEKNQQVLTLDIFTEFCLKRCMVNIVYNLFLFYLLAIEFSTGKDSKNNICIIFSCKTFVMCDVFKSVGSMHYTVVERMLAF